MPQFLERSKTKLCYYERGSGQPLILIMGFGADGNTWEKHVLVYEKYFRCIMIDNRGVGSSDQPRGPYTTQMMAEDVAAVMHHAGIARAAVAGISMGGAIAQELALTHPEKVSRLLLISTWSRFNEHTKEIYKNLKTIRASVQPEVYMELLQLWIYAPKYFRYHMPELIEGRKQAATHIAAQTKDGFEGQIDACILHDSTSRLERIDIPTLITAGEKDIFTPLDYAAVLHKNIKNAEIVTFPDGAHVHHWEDLERFNDVSLRFLLK